MRSTFEKLHLKQSRQALVLNAPESLEPDLKALAGVEILRSLEPAAQVPFALVFVTRQEQVDSLAPAVARAVPGDGTVWFAYPKGSSKKYRSEVTRDRGWQPLGDLGFEPVSNIAIDDDWTALRFRRAEFIRKMTRAGQHRMRAHGKARQPTEKPAQQAKRS